MLPALAVESAISSKFPKLVMAFPGDELVVPAVFVFKNLIVYGEAETAF